MRCISVARLGTMEEAFRREKEEADRLLREQKRGYESIIVKLQQQVMETSMVSSMLSSSSVIDGIPAARTDTLQEDADETDHDELSCKRRARRIECAIVVSLQIALGQRRTTDWLRGYGRNGATIK